MNTDSILLELRAAILENPDDEALREQYARRLDDLGDPQAASVVRGQRASPSSIRSISGSAACLPFVSSAVERRGFVRTITMPREHCSQIGEILRDNPITCVYFDEIDDMVLIRHDSDEARWEVAIGVEFPGAFLVTKRRYWPQRENLVGNIGEWVHANARVPHNTEFDRMWRAQYPD